MISNKPENFLQCMKLFYKEGRKDFKTLSSMESNNVGTYHKILFSLSVAQMIHTMNLVKKKKEHLTRQFIILKKFLK